ncbi:hypothetical protein ONZ45_g4731 [Pleurotus djamor]|nr:hypothetical protein ONZ45_g4731 [Pleurotus djamor]
MGHHEFCLFCAVAFESGPTCLRHESHFSDHEFAEELLAENPDLSLPEASQIVDILKDLFEELSRYSNMSGWLMEGGPDRAVVPRNVAIGHWDDDGEGIYQIDGDIIFPTGRNAKVYIVDGPSSSGAYFSQVFSPETRACVKENAGLYCNAYADNPCFALHESCYHYLRSWLQPHLLTPATRVADAPLTFDEELYEIVNSRKELRMFYKSYLPCIDYGVAAAGMEDQYQDFFSYVRRKGSKAIARAISAGLRGYDLIPAILLDFRVWIYASTDTWPTPSDSQLGPLLSLSWSSTDRKATCFQVLPDELLHLISLELDIPSFLALSSTCWELRSRFLSPESSEYIFRTHVLSNTGSLRWILPVESCLDELYRANYAVKKWLPAHSDAESPRSLFEDPSLPYFDFVRACHLSMSMMNRRRLWGMMEQFRCLWEDYRVNGWEVDRFFPSP